MRINKGKAVRNTIMLNMFYNLTPLLSNCLRHCPSTDLTIRRCKRRGPVDVWRRGHVDFPKWCEVPAVVCSVKGATAGRGGTKWAAPIIFDHISYSDGQRDLVGVFLFIWRDQQKKSERLNQFSRRILKLYFTQKCQNFTKWSSVFWLTLSHPLDDGCRKMIYS